MKVRRWFRVVGVVLVVAMLASLAVLPVLAYGGTATVNMADTYTMSMRMPVYNLDGTKVDTIRTAILTIADNTVTTFGVITNATLVVPVYGTIAVTGFVGKGNRPYLTLTGTAGDVTVQMTGRVRVNGAVPVSISGRIDGYGSHSQGTLGDDPVGGAATWSGVATHEGSRAALLTQAAAPGSTYVQFTPPTGITLGQMSVITAADWGLWFNLQDSTNGGPQVELRFAAPTNVNPDGAGHVDVTLMTPTTGTGLWVNRTFTGAFPCMYYGNDPWDGTAFDSAAPGTLANAEVEINSEAAMTANGSIASNWVLTRVRVELWEAGARTCYVDDVEIDGVSYSFEPVIFAGGFSARP